MRTSPLVMAAAAAAVASFASFAMPAASRRHAPIPSREDHSPPMRAAAVGRPVPPNVRAMRAASHKPARVPLDQQQQNPPPSAPPPPAGPCGPNVAAGDQREPAAFQAAQCGVGALTGVGPCPAGLPPGRTTPRGTAGAMPAPATTGGTWASRGHRARRSSCHGRRVSTR